MDQKKTFVEPEVLKYEDSLDTITLQVGTVYGGGVVPKG